MTGLSLEKNDVVLINTIFIKPDRCEQLLVLLSCTNEDVMRQVPWRITVILEKSQDSSR